MPAGGDMGGMGGGAMPAAGMGGGMGGGMPAAGMGGGMGGGMGMLAMQQQYPFRYYLQ